MTHDDLKKLNVPQDVIDAARKVEMDAVTLGKLVVNHSVAAARDFLDWLKSKLPLILFGVLVAGALSGGRVQGQCLCEGGCLCRDCDCGLSYDAAYEQAVREGRPFVVYVRQRPTPVPGCVVCRRDAYPGQTQAGVILGLPDQAGGIDEVARRDDFPTPQWISKRFGEVIRQRQQAQAEREKIAAQPRFFAPTGLIQRACVGG